MPKTGGGQLKNRLAQSRKLSLPGEKQNLAFGDNILIRRRREKAIREKGNSRTE